MSIKAFGAVLVLLLTALSTWYFFIKKHDFTVSFKTQAAPGIVYSKLLSWEYLRLLKDHTEYETPYREIIHKGEIEDVPFLLNWKFSSVNDSVTNVQVGVENLESRLTHRFNLLLGTENFREKISNEVIQLMKTLKSDAELYKISIQGKNLSPGTFCACISRERAVDEKAFEMMATINELSNFILQHELETNGRPRVQITKWDHENNRINFDFCFPLDKISEHPEHPVIFFKEIAPVTSLKAIYNGNYMFSHYAWLELMSYAELNGIEVSTSPLEIFHDDPELGGNPINWEAEIFLPIKK